MVVMVIVNQPSNVTGISSIVIQAMSEHESRQSPFPTRAKERLQALMKWRINYEAILLDEELLQHVMRFYSMTAEWMSSVAGTEK